MKTPAPVIEPSPLALAGTAWADARCEILRPCGMHAQNRAMSRLYSVTIAGALLVTMVLCSACGSTTRMETSTKTAGEQLMELQEAKDKGLVSDKEFERMRRKIVQDND
jgi:hypothetical protein